MAGVPKDDAWLTEKEAAWAARMRYPKRRSEFRLGRFTAKRALALLLGLPAAPADLRRFEIDRSPDGAPAPRLDGAEASASVSMTDRADWAVCLTGPPCLGIGCDLEIVEPRSGGFIADYLTAAEQARVRGAASGDRELLANLMWSAKESALKVLRTGLRRDTRSVEVDLGPGPGDTWTALSITTHEGRRFPGYWRRYGAFLLTCAATEAFAPPAALVEPPGLATAIPSHLWWAAPGPESSPL